MIYPHWHYFLTLVEDLENSSRYAEITRDNFKTYSVEFTRILLATCSEIDVVAKLLCTQINPGATAKNINDYRKIITPRYPALPSIEIFMPRSELDFQPWESWKRSISPPWWNSYNKVKHQRDQHHKEANLETAVNAVGALCILVCHLYHIEMASHKLNPVPTFLFLGTQYRFGSALIGVPNYCLPDFPQPRGKWELKGKQQICRSLEIS